jgi:hypothetical protein
MQVLLKWAIEHFGADCSPRIAEGADGMVLSVTNIEHGMRRVYHLPIKPVEGRAGWFSVGGVTVDTNTVH